MGPSPSAADSPAANGAPLIGGRYPDGIPSEIGGQLVFRGSGALAYARAATDATPFLIGGWVTWDPGIRYCTVFADGSTWLRDCVRPGLSDKAGGLNAKLTNATTFRFILDQVTTGPVVARVRVHDPRSSSCGSQASECARMMVALEVVWAGDEATAPRPLSIDAIELALRGIQDSGPPVPRESDPPHDCGDDHAAADVYVLAASHHIRPFVCTIEVEPSVDARERALGLAAGASGALTRRALFMTTFSRTPSGSWSEEYRWLAVQNVILVVRTHHGPTPGDRAFINQLAEALERAAAAGS